MIDAHVAYMKFKDENLNLDEVMDNYLEVMGWKAGEEQ